MKSLRRIAGLFAAACLIGLISYRHVLARPSTPLADDAYDGGFFSAETLGRGGTYSSARGSGSAGSENPATMAQNSGAYSFGTALVGASSQLHKSTVTLADPLDGKIFQYLSMGQDRGALFYEPLGRRRDRFFTTLNSNTDYRDIEFTANAIGFSAGAKVGQAHIGISMAYLWANLSDTLVAAGQPDRHEADTADGLRLNFGARYPAGPTMFGITLQNAPGFLWWKDYRRDMLPVKVRIGNTWRLRQGILFSAEAEERFYNEGGNRETFYYLGNETFVGRLFALRAGLFGKTLDAPEDRHWTAGATMISRTGGELSYALEIFEIGGETIKRSFVSLKAPFSTLSEK